MQRTIRPFAVLAVALFLAWLVPVPLAAQSDDPATYASTDSAGDFARVTYQENGVTIRRAFSDDGLPPVSEATVNAPIYAGDTVLTAQDQRAEAQLSGGTLVRIDQGTDLTFLGLPDPASKFADNSVLQLAEGTIRISAHLAEGEEFRVDTPAASIYFLGDGDFRIEVTPGGRTEVVSRRGVAEVVGNGGSILVRGGTRTEVFPGTLPEEPWAFNTFVTDNFDRWVADRDAIYQVRDRYAEAPGYSPETYEALPEEVRPYYQELNHSGQWIDTPEYGYVWYPTAVAATWRPYYDGYWDYGPGGWFWVSYEPWGWAPYHYGRWNWLAGYGWCWAPGRVFAGAWVAWSWGSLYVGWAPLNYWGSPCYVGGVSYGYYDPHSWTFVGYAYVGSRSYQRHAVPVNTVGDDLRHATVVSHAPRVAPTRLATSRADRARAMRLVEEDRADRIAPIDRTARPERSFRDLESRTGSNPTARGRVPGAEPAPAVRGARAGSPNPGRTGSAADPSSRSDARAAERAGSRGATFPAYPRRITSDPARSRAGVPGTTGTAPTRRSAGSGPARSGSAADGTPARPVRARDADRAGTDGRVPDFYRRIATPRSTPTRSDAPGGSSPTPPPARANERDRAGAPRGSDSRAASPPPKRETSRTGTSRSAGANERKPANDRPSGQRSEPSRQSQGRTREAPPKKKDDGAAPRQHSSASATRRAPAARTAPASSRVASRPPSAPGHAANGSRARNAGSGKSGGRRNKH